MPRIPRIDVPDMVYHVYARGNKGTALFVDNQDRKTFLTYLLRSLAKYPCQLLGYCLMTTHYHLQLRTLSLPLAKTMHLLNTLYAGYFNHRHEQFGHVFQNRYHSIPVAQNNYLLALSRYIHLNPVAAGMVARPEDHLWSSYIRYLLPEKGIVETDLVLSQFSYHPQKRHVLYREFVEEKIGKRPEFTDAILRKTRMLGSDSFIRFIRSKTRVMEPGPVPGDAF